MSASNDVQQVELPCLPPRDDAFAHWVGMPMFDQEDRLPIKRVIVSMYSESDVIAFAKLIGKHMPLTGTSSIGFYADE